MTLLVTGFPGFLGKALLPRLLDRESRMTALCLVQPKFMATAEQSRAELDREQPGLASRMKLVAGDITEQGLGLGAEAAKIASTVSSIYHLAAVYDLAVSEELGTRVNVLGTRGVLEFAERVPKLDRLHYVSTCYVSGRYAGRFFEADLEKGQRFNNYYESTKHEAEVLVRRRMQGGLPATIYRPSIVVGDSRTGATQKYDGPYFIIQWLLRQKRLAYMPVVGDLTNVRFNVVPRDFVVDAIAYLSGEASSVGKTYQLADPEPLTVDELLKAIAVAIEQNFWRIPLPMDLAKWFLSQSTFMRGWLRIPPPSLDYFAHPTTYDTQNADADLGRAGLKCPRLVDYLPNLVGFFRAHPEFAAAAMV